MVCRLRPERRDEYLELHRDVWPAVEAMNHECGIRNFSIFVRDDVLFGYYEYVGDDLNADQLKMAADPVTQQWWALTDACQVPFDGHEVAGRAGNSWPELEHAMHQA